MAILILRNKEKIYFSDNGIVTERDKEIADKIDLELESGLKEKTAEFLKRKWIAKEGRKKRALEVWFALGYFLLKLAEKYKIFRTNEEIYYWQAVYDHLPKELQKNAPPQDFRKLASNQYRKAALMAEYNWEIVKLVGNWATWNDILDNPKILSDKRIIDWIIKEIIAQKIKHNIGHKEIRRFLYAVSRRLSKLDTKILDKKELEVKLKDIDESQYFDRS